MKGLKHLDLMLENLDIARIDPADIDTLSIENVQRDIHFLDGEGLSESTNCQRFYLVLKKHANKPFTALLPTEPETVFQRLSSSRDITQIVITYKAPKGEERIFVPWPEDDDPYVMGTPNPCQSSALDCLGQLHILISKTEHITQEMLNRWNEELEATAPGSQENVPT